jgi:hypothetical protein
MAKLRRVLTHPGKNESGQGALAMVLLFLMLGAIILTPLLVFMQTGVKAGRVYESKAQEFYAADAGVEDAIWNITYANLTTPATYTLADEVNNRTTNVTVEPVSGGGHSGYKITSTATSNSGSNTTIECYYGTLDYSSLLDNAISSNGTVDIKNKVDVTGNVSTPNCTYAGYPSCGCPNCSYSIDCVNCTNCCSQEPLSWPTAEELSRYYYDKVKNLNLTPHEGDMDINIATLLTPPEIGPLYVDGKLTIYNDEAGKSAKLNGIVYVTGDTTIEGSGNKNWTLNLNNQTIFVESDSIGSGHEALKVGGSQVALAGSGCIIVVGDIDFHPSIASGSENDFIFIMSVENTVTLLPSGNFYGSVAGELEVGIHSGENPFITHTDYGDIPLDFPMGQTENKVLSYTIR